ncbi:oxidoreductase [Oceaniovalibus guishaninsula JLT2003]|uniref:Oxidoreductase n=1 Tax=Oceaniovalibus guishaninsula JLT2003 TaxID=1231392 RepID=K2I4X6_9RHOB|nr:aldo/keto reductase [Oceaniovalibus guishaninsula]EKE43980.1 oxidoreductase [Oceaniovalibus guishaninsula JLT2003]
MNAITTLSGAPLSRLCFGAMQFGGAADASASRAMFEACRAAGINAFDTAHVYTGGRSEEILGALTGAARDDIAIATKVDFQAGNAPETIRRSADTSARRLGVDVIDILYLHRWDAATPLADSIAALADLQRQGRVRYLGVSNFAAWQVMKAQAVAAAHGTRIDMIQPMYNLVKRQTEVELFPMCLSEGIAALPYSPLGGGLLSGKYSAGGSGRITEDDRYAARYRPDWMHRAAADLATLAMQADAHPATLAVAWAMRHPAVTAPIVSARSAEQLAPSLAALDFGMDDALCARISALGHAPPPATDRLEEV